ncbi:MAG: glycoside hydrolase family 3 C-terminal domain-containing protein [Bacilli bacterium]|nr:glycoside hydrolase family 3 C-terminal domain-containing protein [Bacilli bacterium]
MKKNKVIKLATWSALGLLTLGLAITATAVTNYYDGVIRDFLGVIGKKRVNEVNDGLDKQYNVMGWNSIEELNEYETKLVRDMGGEGYVLLHNDTTEGKGLPLKTSKTNKTKISIFSHSSVDLVAGGTGSGTGSLDVDFKTALESQDYEVNEKLWNFYKSGNGKDYVRGPGSINYGHGAEDWRINECPLSVLEKENGLLDSTKDSTAMFVLTRTGGEGRDLARDMSRYTSIEEDKSKHYLEPDSVELGVIDYLNSHFDNVIIIVNTNNVMELGWTKNYPNIKSVLWAPGGGGQTANSIADVISGRVTPSGHLVDTIAYDAFSAPSMKNFGDIQYVDQSGNPVTSDGKALTDISNTSSQNNGYYGVSYDEGIYVGYKYYETRYFDKMIGKANVGDFNYDTEVQYPFGYGLSYTTFEWSDFTVGSLSGKGTFECNVTVKNTGTTSGKEAVGIYLNSPYTQHDIDNHIEKSAVSLVGFAKTKLLAPGEKEELTINVNVDDFLVYDDVSAKTYILENGTYALTAASDAHKATNNFLKVEGAPVDGEISMVDTSISFVAGDGTNYEVKNKSKSDAEITNRFDDANYIDRTKYLSRNNWEATFPTTHGYKSNQQSMYSQEGGFTIYEKIDDALIAKLKQKGTAEAANSPLKDEDVAKLAGTFGNKGDLELIDYRGKEYNEEEFLKLSSQMTESEVATILNLSGYTTAKAVSISKPEANDLDGPMGLNLMATHEPFSVAYPAEVTIAASWNIELSIAHGDAIASDGLRPNVLAAGWYGPGVNIHRTPFSGRNFEYYSEDSFMVGSMAHGAIKAAAKKGMYSFIKHFALNDQEDHRDQNGVCSWSNEQAIREIYLKPFQMVFEGGTVETKYYDYADGNKAKVANTPIALAVMTSFNRIGSTWAGGDYRLITQVLRNEWNFNGLALTDYSNGATSYMHTEQMLRAGGDAQLSQYGVPFANLNAANIYYAKRAMAHINYTVVNSNTMNGFSHGATVGYNGFPNYYFILIALFGLSASLIGIGAWRIIGEFKKKEN